jgi:hypothetical protein
MLKCGSNKGQEMKGVIEQTPDDDFLERTTILGTLQRHIKELAYVPLDRLPAPRVLAVDAPWGFGKSWVAERLRTRLKGDDGKHPVAFIDAFRYDHHDDVFAVIAAAIMKELNPKGEQRKRYLATAGQVMKAGAPAVVKGLLSAGLKIVGVDSENLSDSLNEVKDAVTEQAGKFSEKAVERLFESYSKTEVLQEDFQNSLDEITKGLPTPFVVIIDELDRCKPSFALEVLERVKHLFSASNVVFVLFWNSQSIHESIRHSYGRDTDAAAYLSKFVARSVHLALPYRADIGAPSRYSSFIERELTRVAPNASDREEFQRALADLSGVLNPSLRDVQKAIDLFRLGAGARMVGTELAYLALVYVANYRVFRKLVDEDAATARDEASRLPVPDVNAQVGPIEEIWMVLTYLSNPDKYDQLAATRMAGDNELDAFLVSVLKVGSSGRRTHWMGQTGRMIVNMMTNKVN